MLPVMAAGMSGSPGSNAIVTKTVITPMLIITPTIARGTFLAGSWTSSAIDPAASNPRNVQPMNATAPSHPIQSQWNPPAPVLNEWSSVENGFTR